MDHESPGEITALFRRAADGDSASAERLFEVLYPRLRELAARQMANGRPDLTLQPTALVHEAWVRLSKAGSDWRDREHFLAVAARAMRCVLVDAARCRNAAKRGGLAQREELTGLVILFEERAADLVALDDALRQLAARSEAQARVVELRFFGGLSMQQTARVLEMSRASAERLWYLARAWLRRELGG